jgi:hypothetical protein
MEQSVLTDIQQKAFLNIPYTYSSVCVIYPLTIREIVALGPTKYSSYLSILTMDEFDIAEQLKKRKVTIDPTKITVLQFIIDSAKRDYTFLLEVKSAFRTFIREKVNILFDDYTIVSGDGQDKRLLTLDNFGEFQNIIRVQNKRTVKTEPPKDESPIQRKFRLKAEFRDAVKRRQKSNDPDAPDFLALMSAFCCYDGLTPEQVGGYSFFAFREVFERHQLKDKYSLDVRSILAGADPKKVKPKPWIKKSTID